MKQVLELKCPNWDRMVHRLYSAMTSNHEGSSSLDKHQPVNKFFVALILLLMPLNLLKAEANSEINLNKFDQLALVKTLTLDFSQNIEDECLADGDELRAASITGFLENKIRVNETKLFQTNANNSIDAPSLRISVSAFKSNDLCKGFLNFEVWYHIAAPMEIEGVTSRYKLSSTFTLFENEVHEISDTSLDKPLRKALLETISYFVSLRSQSRSQQNVIELFKLYPHLKPQ